LITNFDNVLESKLSYVVQYSTSTKTHEKELFLFKKIAKNGSVGSLKHNSEILTFFNFIFYWINSHANQNALHFLYTFSKF